MYHHLILISDGIPTPSGAGISQTLANLLDAYPGSITCVCADAENTEQYADRLPAALHRYPTGSWPGWSNRIGLWLNPFFRKKNLQWMMRQPMDTSDLPTASEATVLVSTTVPHKLLYAWLLMRSGYTVLPYFMDDWMAGHNRQWKYAGSWYSLHRIAKELLEQAPAWLMISAPLQQILTNRYHLRPKPCLIIHNPAPVLSETPAAKLPQMHNCTMNATENAAGHAESFLIIYAGSVWPMHADALIAVAKAVHLLQQQGNAAFELHLYVSPAHWAQHAQALSGPGVTCKGWKPYREVHQYLAQGWLLLCTASFEAAYQPFSRSSVQTKLTDYMACGRPVLFAGPADAASGLFVDAYDIGFTMATSEPADIAERLLAIARRPVPYRRKQENALREARTTFSKATVQQQLYDFLAQHGPAPTRHRP